MNAFANTLFSLLLGWVKALAQAVWNLFSEDGAGGFLTWLGDHWLPVVAFICLCGVVVDMLIWLLRWRPDLVWRTKWRHLLARLRGHEMRDSDQRAFYQGYQGGVNVQGENGLYADEEWEDVSSYDQAYAPTQQVGWWEVSDQAPGNVPEEPMAAWLPQQAVQRPDAVLGGETAPRRRRSDRYQKAERVDPIARFREKLMEPSRDDDGMIDGLPPIVDKEQAFHAPVYPTQEYTKK